MVQDVKKCYNCKIGGIGDMEIRKAYNRLCDNKVLKEEFNIVERKGLTCALDFPTMFKTEWIRLVVTKIHDGFKIGSYLLYVLINLYRYRPIGLPTYLSKRRKFIINIEKCVYQN